MNCNPSTSGSVGSGIVAVVEGVVLEVVLGEWQVIGGWYSGWKFVRAVAGLAMVAETVVAIVAAMIMTVVAGGGQGRVAGPESKGRRGKPLPLDR